MRQLTKEQRCAIVRCLVDGVSIRGTTRITGFSKGTIQRLTRDLGEAVLDYQDKVLKNLKCERVQCDELWAFCYAKEKNLPDSMKDRDDVGSIWTWTAMCATTKLIFSWRLGSRDASTGNEFMQDVADRLSNRVQLTSDGHAVYLKAVESAFGGEIDFAQLVKLYGEDKKGETRYSPAKCLGAKRKHISGDPDPAHISTAFAERQNLNIRMQNRRYTRLTNAFSKKAEMLAYSVAITFMYHNFVRIHQTLRSTPAMKAGITETKWSIEDMVDLIPDLIYNTRPKKAS